MKLNMKACLLFISLLFAVPIWSQSNAINCPKPFRAIRAEEKFRNDVANNSVAVYSIGGIVSAVREREVQFGKKYNVSFHDFGCVVPANLSFYEQYNQLVFELLSRDFGLKWLEEISPNVIGINKYKEKI